MAFNTPLPWYLFLSLSLSSNASFLPVDAPLGTDATAFIPDSRVNSTSTVGFYSYLASILIIKYYKEKIKVKEKIEHFGSISMSQHLF